MKFLGNKSHYFIYCLSIFISSFLLFMVQPMMTKAMMPYLGGTPNLWQVSVAIYQVLLLLGYLYAHVMVKYCTIKRQSMIHAVVMVTCMLFMPLSLRFIEAISISNHPFFWTVMALILSVSLPFFLLSANSVMAQHWFVGSVQGAAKNPYFLYVISNLGSLISLLAYPFLFEKYSTLSFQFNLWSQIFILFLLLLMLCLYLVRQHYDASRILHMDDKQIIAVDSTVIGDDYDRQKPTLWVKCQWVLLAFAVCSLMLGTTSYICDDIGGVPMFWMMPLALYLLSFVIAFSGKMKCYQSSLNIQLVLTAFIFAALVKALNFEFKQLITLYLATFFMMALNCHKRLFDLRPHPSHLTHYYLWISLGGVLGGLFNGFLAPLIFNTNSEYFLALLLVTWLRPLQKVITNQMRFRIVNGVMAVTIFMLIGVLVYFFKNHLYFIVLLSLFIVPMMASASLYPQRLTLVLVAILLAFFSFKDAENVIYQTRNFFGVKKISKGQWQQDPYHLLQHGTTFHGVQYLNDKAFDIVAYYQLAMREIYASVNQSEIKPMAVIGLGTGNLACLGDRSQQVDFYEIDPQVVKIAQDIRYFSYITHCPATSNIVVGDGRIELAKAKDNQYGLIVVDAFSSDAIPFHLLTQEALQIYLQKLAPDGVIAFHISNKYLDLAPVLKANSDALHAISKYKYFKSDKAIFSSNWVIVTKKRENLKGLPLSWKDMVIPHDVNRDKYLWKDDKYFILDVLR